MKRTPNNKPKYNQLATTALVFGLLLITLVFGYSNCMNSRVSGRGGASSVVSIGNPFQPSNLILSEICNLIQKCHSEVTADACTSGAQSASGFASVLGLSDSTYPTFASLILAESNAEIVISSSQSQACQADIKNESCTLSAVQAAYNPGLSNPFSQSSGILSAATHCANSYSSTGASNTSTSWSGTTTTYNGSASTTTTSPSASGGYCIYRSPLKAGSTTYSCPAQSGTFSQAVFTTPCLGMRYAPSDYNHTFGTPARLSEELTAQNGDLPLNAHPPEAPYLNFDSTGLFCSSSISGVYPSCGSYAFDYVMGWSKLYCVWHVSSGSCDTNSVYSGIPSSSPDSWDDGQVSIYSCSLYP